MKKKLTLITILIIFMFHPTIGQESNNNDNKNGSQFNLHSSTFDSRPFTEKANREEVQQIDSFNCDCETDFWSVNPDGEIQLWSLVDDSIYGGSTILTGAPNSIAYCGLPNFTTFYGGRSPDPGISYFEYLVGWKEIEIPTVLVNNGGYLDNQYYMGIATDPYCRILYSMKGDTIFMIDSLSDKQYTVADIAVDSLGQAWTFIGNTWDLNSNIYVYNYAGLVKSYNITFRTQHAYGSTFINDTLYISFGPNNPNFANTLVPVIVDENTAQLGTPISFPPYLYDLASCRCIQPTVNIGDESIYETQIKVFPNPASSVINISNLDSPATYRILDMAGHLVNKGNVKSGRINLEKLPEGMYFLELNTENHSLIRKVIKQ
ncbi:MAG: T9SS type A sorting domain-containing protein [Bacteroidales bacterium]|nr:T9SS type A sorting domain-containing protein [Bacteroidales bacterium]